LLVCRMAVNDHAVQVKNYSLQHSMSSKIEVVLRLA
jgi:hypothetical protein